MNNRLPNYNNDFYIKINEKYELKRKANGLGIFIFSYFGTMIASSLLLGILFLQPFSKSFQSDNSPAFYLLEIFISVLAAFLPSLIYIVLSHSDINKIISCKAVKLSVLIPVVMIGMGTAMFANAASDLLNQNFSFFGVENNVDFNNSSSTLLSNILYVVSTAVVPAFAEEFAFRGIVMGSLRKYGDAFAIIVSSVLFGAMHGNIVQIPFAFILGLVFAFIDCKTNSIVPSIIVHFINNFYAIIMDILQNEGFISDSMFFIIYYVCIFVFCAVGLLSFAYLAKKDKNFFRLSSHCPENEQYAKHLSFKEKITAFFVSPGIVAVLAIFLLQTIFALTLV